MAADKLPVTDIAVGAGRSWWLILLFGTVSVVFGAMAILDPVRVGASLVWALGLLAVADGVLGLIAAFQKEGAMPRGWMVAYGLVSIGFGVAALWNPVSMAAALVVWMAVWVILAGVLRIVWAVRLRKALRNEWALVLSGLLAVVLGGLMLFMPVAGLILAVVWMGVAALVVGLLQIFAAIRVRRASRV